MAVDRAYIEKTLPKVLDEVYAQESLTQNLLNKGNQKIKFLDAKTIKVFDLASTGYQVYARGGSGVANAEGAVSTKLETFTLRQERFAKIPVDKLDEQDDGDTIIGNLATQFGRIHHTQELDAYRFSKLASYTSATYGNRVSESISANTIISKFNSAFRWMKNHKVPAKSQVIYVSTTVMELIRNTTELQRRLMVEEVKKNDVYFTIERYEGRQIVEVPEDEFFTDLVLGNGYYPASSSKTINFLIVDDTAPVAVENFNFIKLYSSEETRLDYVGYELQVLCYHDIFVPDNKKPGIYCSVSTTDASNEARGLLVDAVAGTSGKTVINDVLTEPAGILYDKLYLSTSASKPAIGSATAGLTAITIGTEFTPNASHNFIVASYDGKAVAVSKDFEDDLPVGA